MAEVLPINSQKTLDSIWSACTLPSFIIRRNSFCRVVCLSSCDSTCFAG